MDATADGIIEVCLEHNELLNNPAVFSYYLLPEGRGRDFIFHLVLMTHS